MRQEIHDGLIVDTGTTPPTCCGYIFNFGERGAFAPDSKVEPAFSEQQIAEHNRLLGVMELTALKRHGCGLLYLFKDKTTDRFSVGTWAAKPGERISVSDCRQSRHSVPNSWHNTQRTDVWFYYEGQRFWGVNIGDNDCVRVRKVKNRGL